MDSRPNRRVKAILKLLKSNSWVHLEAHFWLEVSAFLHKELIPSLTFLDSFLDFLDRVKPDKGVNYAFAFAITQKAGPKKLIEIAGHTFKTQQPLRRVKKVGWMAVHEKQGWGCYGPDGLRLEDKDLRRCVKQFSLSDT